MSWSDELATLPNPNSIRKSDSQKTVDAPQAVINAVPRNGAMPPLTPLSAICTAMCLGTSLLEDILVIITYPMSSMAAYVRPEKAWAAHRSQRFRLER